MHSPLWPEYSNVISPFDNLFKSNARNLIPKTTLSRHTKTKLLKPVCCKKRQKCPNQETGLGNRGHLIVLKDTKLVLKEHEPPP